MEDACGIGYSRGIALICYRYLVYFWVGSLAICDGFGMNKLKLHEGIAIIEVDDPLILTEIESDGGLRPFIGEKLSDRCISVQPHAIQEVTKRLQSLGHLPRVIS